MRHAIKNGGIILEENAVVNITLAPVQSNFSVYEALRVLNKHVVHLEDHVERLKNSAFSIGLNLPKVEWKEEIDKLIERRYYRRNDEDPCGRNREASLVYYLEYTSDLP